MSITGRSPVGARSAQLPAPIVELSQRFRRVGRWTQAGLALVLAGSMAALVASGLAVAITASTFGIVAVIGTAHLVAHRHHRTMVDLVVRLLPGFQEDPEDPAVVLLYFAATSADRS